MAAPMPPSLQPVISAVFFSIDMVYMMLYNLVRSLYNGAVKEGVMLFTPPRLVFKTPTPYFLMPSGSQAVTRLASCSRPTLPTYLVLNDNYRLIITCFHFNEKSIA